MPHDRNGLLLQVGDRVLVEATVKSIVMQEDYCNVTLETACPMPPYTVPTTLTLNAKQVAKMITGVGPAAAPEGESSAVVLPPDPEDTPKPEQEGPGGSHRIPA